MISLALIVRPVGLSLIATGIARLLRFAQAVSVVGREAVRQADNVGPATAIAELALAAGFPGRAFTGRTARLLTCAAAPDAGHSGISAP